MIVGWEYNNRQMTLILTLLVVFVLLVCNEWWWRSQRSHTEINRKFIHITVGTFVAFWPLFLSWQQIRWLSLAFLIVVALSKYLHIFKAIHSVQRPTWGEIFFAVAVGAVTFITHDKWIFAAAVLQMALADGLAAIIGVQYGRKQSYLIFGQAKSVIGTATFIFVSVYILFAFMYISDTPLPYATIFGLAAAAGVIENFGVFGLDNLLVPVLIAFVLQQISH